MARYALSVGRYKSAETRLQNTRLQPRYTDGNQNRASEENILNAPPETHGTYGALLLHPKWKARRQEILIRDNHQCVVCTSTDGLEIHHRQYHFRQELNQFQPPWDYPDHLLITLCNKCHQRGHNQFKVPTIIIP